MAKDLNEMSRKQLEKLIKDAEAALKTVAQREKREARKAAEKAAAEFGFTLDQLTGGEGKKRGAKASGAPKYRNPADEAQTWTGKGRQPVWFKDAIAAGTAAEDMAI